MTHTIHKRKKILSIFSLSLASFSGNTGNSWASSPLRFMSGMLTLALFFFYTNIFSLFPLPPVSSFPLSPSHQPPSYPSVILFFFCPVSPSVLMSTSHSQSISKDLACDIPIWSASKRGREIIIYQPGMSYWLAYTSRQEGLNFSPGYCEEGNVVPERGRKERGMRKRGEDWIRRKTELRIEMHENCKEWKYIFRILLSKMYRYVFF